MQKKLTRSRGIRREATAAPPLAVAHVCAAAPPWAASSPARSQPVSAPSLPRGRPARRGVLPATAHWEAGHPSSLSGMTSPEPCSS